MNKNKQEGTRTDKNELKKEDDEQEQTRMNKKLMNEQKKTRMNKKKLDKKDLEHFRINKKKQE